MAWKDKQVVKAIKKYDASVMTIVRQKKRGVGKQEQVRKPVEWPKACDGMERQTSGESHKEIRRLGYDNYKAEKTWCGETRAG